MEHALEALSAQLLGQLFVEVEASGRHVHVTKEQAIILFGHDLTPAKPLSQPGQFAAKERVTVVGPKGRFENVAVLGPARNAAQVEVSLTDARTLGVDAPIRLSGDTANSPGCTLLGPCGEITLPQGVIVAKRHIHLPPEDAARRGLQDKEVVKLKLFSKRPLIFDDVVVRINKDFAPDAHIDYDEANACGFTKGDYGMIVHG